MTVNIRLTSPTHRVEAADQELNVEAAFEFFYDKGWTDGLPVIPPTDERIARMLEYTDRKPNDVLCEMATSYADATVEKVAINAVMAGCRPEYFPVVVAMTQALGEKEFNLHGIQGTTNPVTPFVLVNGPISREIGMNSGAGCLGPGWRANATIGRAARLLLLNIGGGKPGTTDRATHGFPGKYNFCSAENELESPWEPFHVERGFPKDSSTVTVDGASGTHNVITVPEGGGKEVKEGEEILYFMGESAYGMGTNIWMMGFGEPMLVFPPESAQILHRDGFDKPQIRRYMFDVTMRTYDTLAPWVIERMAKRRQVDPKKTDRLTLVQRPEDFLIVCMGGLLPAQGIYIPTFATTKSVTKPVALKDGTHARSVQDFRKAAGS